MFLVFDWGVFEVGRGNGAQIGWLGDRHGGDLGPISLAKRTPCSTALAASSNPSVGTRMFLNNLSSSLLLLATLWIWVTLVSQGVAGPAVRSASPLGNAQDHG